MIMVLAEVQGTHGIGYKGRMPWSLPKELKHAMKLAQDHVIIVGRKTAESMPKKKDMIVVSSKGPTLEEALLLCKDKPVCIMGGAALYNELQHRCHTIYLTVIEHPFECDVYWNGVDTTLFREVDATRMTEGDVSYVMKKFERIGIN